jgi:hypothetical protein
VSRDRVVGFLSLADRTALDFFPFRLRPDFSHDPLSRGVVLFPPEGDGSDATGDYRAHFYANHRVLFALFGLFAPVDLADILLKGTAHFMELGLKYAVNGSILFILCVAGAATRNERFHRFFAVYFLCHTIVISCAIFWTLI